MPKLLLLSLLLLLLCGFSHSAETRKEWSLNNYLSKTDAVWAVTPDDLTKDKLFKWTSSRKKDLRYSANESNVVVKLWSCDVDECIFSFEDNKLTAVSVLFFSRGDSGMINRDVFFDVIDNAKTEVENVWGKPLPVVEKRLGPEKKMNTLQWKSPSSIVKLIWSYTGKSSSRKDSSFLGEYVKLTVSGTETAPATKKPITSSGRLDLKGNVEKNSNGDVLINNIPMVDQGQKGYCVVATAERVLRYYGQEVDQHMLAQASDTSRAGTQLFKMQEAMERLDKKFHFRHRSLYLQKPASGNFIKKFYDAYNSIARKKDKPRFDFDEFTQLLMETENANDTEMKLDYEVLMEVKKKVKRNDYRRFATDIESYVNQGIPCVWTVVLGLVKEKGLPQLSGGHQRLIVGYNKGKNLLYYSDSWGSGHEKKSMTMDEAWTITLALDVYIPMAEKR